MHMERYQAGQHDVLAELSTLLPACHNLCYHEFVDHYYGGSRHCSLTLMRDDNGRCLGVIGLERMPFETPDGRVTMGFGSNFHAFESGAGGFLFLHWTRQCDLSIQFGGSRDARRIVEHQKWNRMTSLQTLEINHAFADPPGEVWWRRVAKRTLRTLAPRMRVDTRATESLVRAGRHIEAVPERRVTNDMLPGSSTFDVRFAPDAEYLNWRYGTQLSFVRYHVFRIVVGQQTDGYVILNEQPHRVLVAQADASDPIVLTQGILAALARVCVGTRRACGVQLTASHPVMQAAFRETGFRVKSGGRDLAVGPAAKVRTVPDDVSRWLINLDWGDNGLRAPFLGRPHMTAGRADERPRLRAA